MGYLVASMHNSTWTEWRSPAGGCV